MRSNGQVTFGDAQYGPSGTCGPRMQRDYQLVCVLSGSARVSSGGSEVEIPEQHVALMLPGHLEHFRFDPRRPTRHTWCSLLPSRLPRALQLPSRVIVLPLSRRLAALLEAGLEAPEPNSVAAVDLLEALATAALAAFCAERVAARNAGREPDLVTRARAHIDAHLHEHLTVEDVAAAVSTSAPNLIRTYRRATGTTPARALWEARTQRGVQLLRETGLTVSEIALQTGFRSPFHFSRLVRERYGFPPRELRRRAWEDGEDFSR